MGVMMFKEQPDDQTTQAFIVLNEDAVNHATCEWGTVQNNQATYPTLLDTDHAFPLDAFPDFINVPIPMPPAGNPRFGLGVRGGRASGRAGVAGSVQGSFRASAIHGAFGNVLRL